MATHAGTGADPSSLEEVGCPALLVAVTTLTNGAAAQVEPVVTAAVQVTADPNPVRARSTPLLARNPKSGELVVADVDVRGSRECEVHLSADDGRSWVKGGRFMVEPFTDCSIGAEYGPHVMPFFDADGELYVVFTANDPQDWANAAPANTAKGPRALVARNVYLAHSVDQGRTFSTRLVYEGPKGNPGLGYNIAPVGAADPSDPSRIYVGWAQGDWTDPNEPVKAVVAASTDAGRSFAAPVDISARQGSEHPWLSVDGRGVVHATYWSKGFGTPLASPSLPIPVARQDPVPIYYVRSVDQGRSWDRQEIDPGNQKYYRPPVIAADPNSDAVYVAWYSTPEPRNFELDSAGEVRSDIFLRASTDGGMTWGSRRVVNDDPGNATNQQLPGLAVAPNGRLDISWNDFAGSPTPPASPDREEGFDNIHYTSSTDRGATFGPSIRVSDRSIDRSIGVWSNNVSSRVAVGIASSDDSVYVAWQDTRAGDKLDQAEDVYFASLHLDGTTTIRDRSTTATWLAVGAGLLLGLGLAAVLGWALLLRRRQ